MNRTRTRICSIFGQIETVVADTMVQEGLCHRIERNKIPLSARWDRYGRLASCALVFTSETERLFNSRVAALRV